MYQSFKRILTVLAVMLVGLSAFAQITTSSLNGKVSDRSGEPVPGAAVIAVHNPSGTQYYAVANAEGRFAINGMRSGGPYSVEISCLGYQSVTYTDITLLLGEAYALNAEMPDDTQMLYKSKGASYLEVIQAQSSLLNARISKVSDDFSKMQAVVNLYQALGGGSK